MSVLSAALTIQRLRGESAAWTVLRSDNVSVAVAVLDAHLGGESRRVEAAELIEKVDRDLAILRDHGFDLPRAAAAYCAEWRSSGILVMRPAEGNRSETFELSPDAYTAIRFLSDLAEPRQTVTESRFATITDRLAALASQTDPDASRRLATLRAERDRIDSEIARVESGEVKVLDAASALERARDILNLAENIPADFARVRAEIERINRQLRERILDTDDAQSHVLDEIFRGVDLLSESDAGRSFAGFYSLILDAETSALFDESVDSVLQRDFAQALSPSQRRFLRRLLRTLQTQSAEVHEVMTAFARGLRRFVQSQEYQQDRVIKRLLREALAEAVPTAHRLRTYDPIGYELELSSVPMRSIGGATLHNPADLETVADVMVAGEEIVDFELLRQLARATEIDMVELTRNVNAAIAKSGSPTIGEVLDAFPATQGVASVVGLLVLAEKHGARETDREIIRWESGNAISRRATIEIHRFTKKV
jgi:hypothetical protein